jgi:hypothetical protein
MERRSGTFEVISKKRRAQLDIAGGSVLHGTVGGTRVSALAALRMMLSWKVGRFAFSPCARTTPEEHKSIAAYLLEATRLEDESTRAELNLPPSRRRVEPRVATTALGGPASIPEDVAPPSSRAPIEGRMRGRMSSAPVKASDAVVSISDAPPAFDLTLELESAAPSTHGPQMATPPALHSLARMMKLPPSQRGAAVEPPPPRALNQPKLPPHLRSTLPPPPLVRESTGKPESGALSRGGLQVPTPQSVGQGAAPRLPASGPQPPRPTPPRPPRPDTMKKR